MEPFSNIQKQILRYAEGEVSYEAFRCWIAEAYSEHAKSEQNTPEQALCRSVEWECADFSEGLMAESALRQSLAILASGGIQIYYGEPRLVVSTGTSTVLSVGQRAGQLIGVGRALEYAS